MIYFLLHLIILYRHKYIILTQCPFVDNTVLYNTTIYDFEINKETFIWFTTNQYLIHAYFSSNKIPIRLCNIIFIILLTKYSIIIKHFRL